MPEVSLPEWEKFLAHHPNAHILQTAAWGELKSAFGWTAARLITDDIGMQILFRRLPLGLTIAYIPKGPVYNGLASTKQDSVNHAEFWADVDSICKTHHAVFLKVEPDAWEDSPNAFWSTGSGISQGFKASSRSIQPRRTILVNLTGSEDDILARMKPKCRYNIRLAEKKHITVRTWDNIDEFHHMMTVTGNRDAFGVHSRDYYQLAYHLLHGSGLAELLVAEYEGKPLAALMVCARGDYSWYLYGASTNEERNRMPAYLLQWEAMRWARKRGAKAYDLWGIPDENEDFLEANFETRNNGLWGVYRFKRGFGGEIRRAAAPLVRVFRPLLYYSYLAASGRPGTGL